MKTRAEIEERVDQLRERLHFVQRLIEEERAKQMPDRSTSLLLFLTKEREVFQFALSELENILPREPAP